MASAEEILNALNRVSPDAAVALAADIALSQYEDAYRGLLVESGPAAFAKCSREVVDLRRRVGRLYVDVVEKTASPAAARAELAGLMPVLDDAVRMREGLAELWLWARGDGEVSKEDIQRDGWTQRIKRDERGRFSRTVSTKGTMSAGSFAARRRRDEAKPRQLGPGEAPEAAFLPSAAQDAASSAVDDEARESAQRRLYAINEVAELQQELKRAFGAKAPKVDVSLRYLDSEGNVGEVAAGVPEGGEYADMGWAEGLPSDFTPIDIQYGPNSGMDPGDQRQMSGQMALGELPGLSMQAADPELIGRLGQAVMSAGGGRSLEPQEWDARENQGPLSRLSGALGSVENVAGMVPGFGGVADLAGGLKSGLDRAQSLNEPMQQAMWRLRGTSKEVAPAFAAQVEGKGAPAAVDQVVNGLLAGSLAPGQLMELADRMESTRNAEHMPRFFRSLSAMVRDGEDKGRSPEQLVRAAQRESAASLFIDQMKKRMAVAVGIDEEELERRGGMANLQLMGLQSKLAGEVGRGFPSEGVVLDEQGRVVQQAVGLGEDHYLPFNIEGMAKLRGGSYVRTREYGGLTGEDLRTLLSSGARSAMVVSRSGVFDLDLAPDMTGARRYNDKTAQMAPMYERILDAVAASGLYVNDVPPDVVDGFAEEAERMRVTDIKGFVDKKKKDYVARQQQFTPADRKEAEGKALQRWRTQHNLGDQVTDDDLMSEPDVVKFVAREVRTAKKNRVRQLKINAEGYEVALKTLQRYFPYYIRDVRRRSLTDVDSVMHPQKEVTTAQFLQQEESTDPWYVKPGKMTAQGVKGSADMALTSERRRQENAVSVSSEPGSGPPAPGGGASPVPSAPGGAPGGGPSSRPPAPGGAPGGAPSGLENTPSTAAGGILAPVQRDPFGDADVDEARSKAADKTRNAKIALHSGLSSAMQPEAAGEYFEQVVSETSEEGADGSLRFYLLEGPSDTERVAQKVVGVIAGGDTGQQVKALKVLGRQPKMVSAMLSEESLDQLAQGMNIQGDPAAVDQARTNFKEAARNSLTGLAEVATTLFADWQKPPADGSLADAWRNGARGPFALPQMEGLTEPGEIDDLLDEEIDGIAGKDRRDVAAALVPDPSSPLSLTNGASALLEERSAFLRAVETMPDRSPDKVAEKFRSKFSAESQSAIRQAVGSPDADHTMKLVGEMPEDATRPAAEAAAQLYSMGIRRATLESVRGGGRPKAVPPSWGASPGRGTPGLGLTQLPDPDEAERLRNRRQGFAKAALPMVERVFGSRRSARGRRR